MTNKARDELHEHEVLCERRYGQIKLWLAVLALVVLATMPPDSVLGKILFKFIGA